MTKTNIKILPFQLGYFYTNKKYSFNQMQVT